MHRLRRFASLLALPLLLQLVLAATAVACTNTDSTKTTATATSAMAGMDMPGAQPVGTSGQSDESHRAPCDRPFSPGACQPLAACASGALAAQTLAVPRVAVLAHDATILVVLTPPSHSTRPELPPPRA